MVAQRAAVGQLVELGHSVFHKFGRLQVVIVMKMVMRMMRSLAGCRQGRSPQDQSCPCYFVRLQDEWVCILPIVIHRILTQYQDIQNYKKVSLHLLIYNRPSVPPTIPSLIVHQGET